MRTVNTTLQLERKCLCALWPWPTHLVSNNVSIQRKYKFFEGFRKQGLRDRASSHIFSIKILNTKHLASEGTKLA